ncbi:lipoyl synthase [Candidatus Micrarchaeota archaeon]|nr:lipoyl synthase [Candidatus Micrarchaeota archaeon]
MSIPLTVSADSALEKPSWLRIKPGHGEPFASVTRTVHEMGLVTVCEEAQCPNLTECWSGGTATFMVLGDTCTRGCRFCAVKTSRNGQPVDPMEPQKIAEAVQGWGLDYVVITSVDRDDLPDQGANHFAECIQQLKSRNPDLLVEVLTPDFRGNAEHVRTIVKAKPDVFAHNVETTRRLQKGVRDPRANYDQSLGVLREAKKMGAAYTKSSLMLGLGENEAEINQTLDDLLAADVDVVTFGQYLRPSRLHLPVHEYVTPERFDAYREMAESKGFLYCASGPFVRSSYRAGEFFIQNLIRRRQRA